MLPPGVASQILTDAQIEAVLTVALDAPSLASTEPSQAPASPRSSPSWMTWVLAAAAVYNLIWGTLVILFPRTMLWTIGFHEGNFSGITPYLDQLAILWQCIGMIVGVYGVGYAVAATNPLRHWPIVLVGFLGKVFGPLGFLWGYFVLGQLPAQMAWTNLTNDLVWLGPFAAILFAAAKAAQATPKSDHSVAEALELAQTQTGQSLADLSAETPVLVIFLRHLGCTFCRQDLAELRKQREQIEGSGTRIVAVHMGSHQQAQTLFAHYGLDDLLQVSDPSCQLYQAFQLGRMTAGVMFHPTVWWRGFQAGMIQGHGVGHLVGDGFQMPGVFLIQDRTILREFRHQLACDRPDYRELSVCPVEAESVSNSDSTSVISSTL